MPTSLSDLTRLTIALIRRRATPADVPYTPLLLAALIAIGSVLDVAIGSVVGDRDNVLAQSLLSSAVVLGLSYAALAWRRRNSRFVQTATALFLCGMVFTLGQGLLAGLAGPVPPASEPISARQIVLGWIMVGVFVWEVMIDAAIMRHALDTPLGVALGVVIGWVITWWALQNIVFGAVH